MEPFVLRHFKETGPFTCAGPYSGYFRSLPDDIPTLGRLVCAQVIHRVTLAEGNTGANAALLYGDMARFLCEPDKNLTALCGLWEQKRKSRILNSPLVKN